MAKYLVKTDDTIEFKTAEWLKDLGESENLARGANLKIQVNPDGTIHCNRRDLELRYSGARLRNDILLHNMQRVANLIKISGSFSPQALTNMRSAMARRWADRIWNRLFNWLKPKLHQEALHAYYLVPMHSRRGFAAYNMLVRSETLRKDLLEGSRFVALTVLRDTCNRPKDDPTKPWLENDIEWQLSSCPEQLLPEEVRNILPDLDGIKMPTNWAMQPRSILNLIWFVHIHNLPKEPLKNTRILQFATRTYAEGHSTILKDFLLDWQDSWEVIKKYNKYGTLKHKYTPTGRHRILVEGARELIRTGKKQRFSEHLVEGAQKSTEGALEKIMAECRPKGSIYSRKDGNVRILLKPLQTNDVISTFQELNTDPIGIIVTNKVPYKFYVNNRLYGVVLYRHAGYRNRNRNPLFGFVGFGRDNEMISKYWMSRVHNIMVAKHTIPRPPTPILDDDWGI